MLDSNGDLKDHPQNTNNLSLNSEPLNFSCYLLASFPFSETNSFVIVVVGGEGGALPLCQYRGENMKEEGH
jgi:hypothetical protein